MGRVHRRHTGDDHPRESVEVPRRTSIPDPDASAPLPTTIEEVLERLDVEIARARLEGSRLGYFAVLYRHVTAAVLNGLQSGRFEDPARMERLDVAFANRYLRALSCWRNGDPTSRCWTLAFETADRWWPVVLQHLLLGMNAHINLDLGLAAAEVAPGADPDTFRRDFQEINRILGEMVDDMQDRLGRVSPWIGLLDRLAGDRDEAIARLGLTGSREGAWVSGSVYGILEDPHRGVKESALDAAAALAGRAVLSPGPLTRMVLGAVRMGERGTPTEVIDALS